MKDILKVISLSIFVVGCAATKSHQYSGGIFDAGSNVYIEGASGRSKITNESETDSLGLEYQEHSVAKFKTSIDLGMRLWDVIFAVEAGRVLNDFEKTVKDITVEGDIRVVEDFKADTSYRRISIMRRTNARKRIKKKPLNGFFSFQVYYDFMLESTFSELPSSEDRSIEGNGYGASFGMHMSGLYYNLGYNWREYENSLKMEEFFISIGLAINLL